jgi:hypothetical protein
MAEEKLQQYSRDDILRSLRGTVMLITFTKSTGEERRMKCSLMPEILAKVNANYNVDADRKFHNSHPDLIVVWDMEKNDWRAFHVSSVFYVEGLDHSLYL